jgi:hypothetical protein
MWEIKKLVSKGAYTYAVVPEHPNATKNGYVLHHRIIVENLLNRLLTEDEVVHHVDANKKNNLGYNLEMSSRSEHASGHGKAGGRRVAILTCPECGTRFERYENRTHLSKGGNFTACSRSCSGKFSIKFCNDSSSQDVADKVANNVVAVYTLLDEDYVIY